MKPATGAEIEESNAQIFGVWKQMAAKFDGAELFDLAPGVTVAWSGVQWPFLNAVGFSRPVADSADLEAKVESAVRYTRTKQVMGMLVACADWLPQGRKRENADVFTRHGLSLGLTLEGMMADDVLPPWREMPELEYRRASDSETRRAICELNTKSYQVPPEWGHEVCARPYFWDDAFAYVGYENGQAVTTTTTFLEDGRLYVGWVATLPEARRKGYAEAVMRHSLAAAAKSSGRSRTVLHATEAGFPIYRAMGYRPITTFQMYFPSL